MIFGFEFFDLAIFIAISLTICIFVCTLAMEAAVLFVPAFVFMFPRIVGNFPDMTPNEAIGLAITVEFFGYTSSVLGYWFRKQVDLKLGLRILMITVPLAVVARIVAFFIPGSGLLIIFGIVLLILAAIIFRAYRHDVRHTCLLCGDSIAAMRMGDLEDDEDEVLQEIAALTTPPEAVDLLSKGDAAGAGRPDLSHTITFSWMDRLIVSNAGILGGFIGVAIGEISNTFLTIRKRVPVKIATGTSALVLHLTILSALCTNLIVLFGDLSFIHAEKIVIPWKIAFILAPVVIIGGQIGSIINSRLSDHILLKLMMTAYTMVAAFVLYNVYSS
ncbi:MAG: TSUP family transporter [Gammaproteobacteria bacterium]